MKQYFWNLWLALTGNNPYRTELDDVRGKYEKTADNVRGLQELYCKTLDMYDEVGKQVKVLERQVSDAKAQEKSLQQLVENLRERISDKEHELEQQAAEFRERMERMKADYQRRIDEYNREIDRLKNAKKSI